MQKPYFNVAAIKEIQERRMALALRKNNDYAGQGDNIALTGAHGLAVRLLDKAMRLHSLTYPGAVQKVTDESIIDTFLDVGNYGDFGVSVMEGTWGVRPPEPIVLDLQPTYDSVKKAGGVPPGFIQFNGMEMSVASINEIFQHLGQPIGSSAIDADKVKAWGARFESLAHRAPPAGTKNTAWVGEAEVIAAGEKARREEKSRKKKRSGGIIIPPGMAKEILDIPGGLKASPKITADKTTPRRASAKKRAPAAKSRKR